MDLLEKALPCLSCGTPCHFDVGRSTRIPLVEACLAYALCLAQKLESPDDIYAFKLTTQHGGDDADSALIEGSASLQERLW